MSMFLSFRIFLFLLLVAFVKPFFMSSMASEDKSTVTLDNYDSPKFKILKKTESYELREYEPTHWVATSNEEGNSNRLFMRLFKYISGDNESKSKIAMTVPVANKIAPEEGTPQNLTMQFFLTAADNPKPNDPNVFLTSYPSFKAYVRTYGGYTSDEKRQENLDALKKDVGENGFMTDYYFSCGYDAPWKFWNRRNEIWLFAKEENKLEKE